METLHCERRSARGDYRSDVCITTTSTLTLYKYYTWRFLPPPLALLQIHEMSTPKDFYHEYCLPDTPDEIVLEEGQRMVAIGDVHGNVDFLVGCLQAARVLDEQHDWCGENTVVIQVGDVLDRGIQEESCIKLLCRLAQQARAEKGWVVVLWGNHETYNVQGAFGYVTFLGNKSFVCMERILEARDERWAEKFLSPPDFALYSEDKEAVSRFMRIRAIRMAAMEPGGPLAGPFFSKLKVAIKVGRSLFIHGGLTVEHVKEYGGSIAKMNAEAKAWILEPKATEVLGMKERNEALTAMEPKFFPKITPLGPLMMRDYSFPPDAEPKTPSAVGSIDAILSAVDVDRIVVGHTVQHSGVNSAVNGKVWRVDIGSSFNSTLPSRRGESKTKVALEVKMMSGKEVASAIE